MPSIPLLGSLFGAGAGAKRDMTSYPLQKSEDEWQVVLNKGMNFSLSLRFSLAAPLTFNPQGGSPSKNKSQQLP